EEYPSSHPERLRELNEQERNEALSYLLEHGRASTIEEAESYLESLNSLKRKLVEIILDEIAPALGQQLGSDKPFVGRPGDTSVGALSPTRKRVSAEELSTVRPE